MNELLPTLQVVLVDQELLAALLADWSTLEPLPTARIKGAATGRAGAADLPLGEAARLLVEGQIHAFQLRYVHEAQGWLDTVSRFEGAFRLVRLADPRAGAR